MTGNVTSTELSAGGIVGEGLGRFENCYNKASVTGKKWVGGIVGHGSWQSILMNNCYNEGEIISKNSEVGGLAGTFAGKINNCENKGKVKSESTYAGGILGQSAGTITISNCYNSGEIEGNGTQAAGIIAYVYGQATVNNCYNTGDVTIANEWISYAASKGIGGTEVKNCYNIGMLYLGKKYIIGATTINNCYYKSSLITNEYVIEDGVIDIIDKSAEEFVTLLNSYKDDEGNYPEEWKKWKLGNDGYPIFE